MFLGFSEYAHCSEELAVLWFLGQKQVRSADLMSDHPILRVSDKERNKVSLHSFCRHVGLNTFSNTF